MPPVVQYFADVPDRSVLSTASHYKYELQILRQLRDQYGYRLEVATDASKLSATADLYYGRWATSAVKSTLLSKVARSPSIVYTGGSEVVNSIDHTNGESYSDRPWWHRLAIKLNLGLCSEIVVPSTYNRREVEKISSGKVRVMPHFIDTDRYSPKGDTDEGAFEGDDYALTISWLSETHLTGKCLYSIIDAIARLDDRYRIVILGADRGGYRSLVKYIDEQGASSQVKVITEFSEDEKIALLRGATLYLQPTLHEGFGMANVEAMSTGTPVITSERGAVPDVVGDKAVFVEPDDPAAIGASLEGLWDDEERRTRLSREGRSHVETNYSLSAGREQFGELLEKYIHGA